MGLLEQIVLFLGGVVLIVPLFKIGRLGAVLGYLAVGLLIGPSGAALVTDVESISHFGELGVVLLLFIIGLELKPSRLWALRRAVFGLGGTQVVLTTAVLAAGALALGLSPVPALLVGVALALSSTAFVLQTLAERGQLTTAHGRAAFAVLLFQDLAVVPVLALVPALGPGGAHGSSDGLMDIIGLILAGAGVLAGGRYLLRPLLRLVAKSGVREVFDALALFIVLGVSLLMEQIGLSMALGAFLAGMLLADSEYRHELEADLEPFKGLLLGLFFISVGMSANLRLILGEPLTIGLLAGALLVTKAIMLFVSGKLWGRSTAASAGLAFDLSQGGEFAFVLLAAATTHAVIDPGLTELLIAAVIVSMVLSPVLFAVNQRLVQPRLAPLAAPVYDEPDFPERPLLIVGFGRFGQVIGRLCRSAGLEFTALEASAEQVEVVRRFGAQVHFGDATRIDLLRAAGAEEARVVVIAVADMETSLELVEAVKRNFPRLEIYARARNRKHVHLLLDLGVRHIIRDTFYSSLALGTEVLTGLGVDAARAAGIVAAFRAHDEATLRSQQAIHHDEAELVQTAAEAAEELAKVLRADADRQALAPD